MHTGVGQAAAACKRRGKSGLRRAGCRVTPWHGDVTKRATETSPAGTLARSAKVRPLKEGRTAGVKRGNLHPEQHQIGKRGAATRHMAGSAELAGKWLEPRGNPGARGMAAGPTGSHPPGAQNPAYRPASLYRFLHSFPCLLTC